MPSDELTELREANRALQRRLEESQARQAAAVVLDDARLRAKGQEFSDCQSASAQVPRVINTCPGASRLSRVAGALDSKRQRFLGYRGGDAPAHGMTMMTDTVLAGRSESAENFDSLPPGRVVVAAAASGR